jgi:hypothetical protein
VENRAAMLKFEFCRADCSEVAAKCRKSCKPAEFLKTRQPDPLSSGIYSNSGARRKLFYGEDRGFRNPYIGTSIEPHQQVVTLVVQEYAMDSQLYSLQP